MAGRKRRGRVEALASVMQMNLVSALGPICLGPQEGSVKGIAENFVALCVLPVSFLGGALSLVLCRAGAVI